MLSRMRSQASTRTLRDARGIIKTSRMDRSEKESARMVMKMIAMITVTTTAMINVVLSVSWVRLNWRGMYPAKPRMDMKTQSII